jgi:hypothetical protein
MVSRNLPFEYFVLNDCKPDGAVVGYVDGHPIRDAVVDGHGRRYRFAGLARRDGSRRLDVASLVAGEWILQPGLVYRQDADQDNERRPDGSADVSISERISRTYRRLTTSRRGRRN